jgi:uncharacterized protein YaeQ
MAQPATVYRASIQLSDLDRNHYVELSATLARHPSETAERLVARLLAFALFHSDELTFTKGVSAGAEPDLWAKEPDGRIALWIEVGLPDPERLIKASRHAGRVILLACGPNRWRWESAHLPALGRMKNLSVYALEQEFLQELVTGLGRSFQWTLTITEGTLYLNSGTTSIETPLLKLCGEEAR